MKEQFFLAANIGPKHANLRLFKKKHAKALTSHFKFKSLVLEIYYTETPNVIRTPKYAGARSGTSYTVPTGLLFST